ncbi:MAG: hypothetical protein IJT15_02255, partial [Rickettsiales bacterium]|nr:hypothetical protein [Rickettsiales bacterium]
MEDVKGTENIQNDVVNIIFDFCKAFNEAQEKMVFYLGFPQESCHFSFDFQGQKFVCNKTYGSKAQNSKMCIIDVSQDDNNDIKINNINKNTNPCNDIEEQQNNTALISKQGNSIGSNYYLSVRYNTIFLTKENNDKKFDVYCFFLGNSCDAKITKNTYVNDNTCKVASNIEKEKIQTFLKNVMVSNVVDMIVNAISISSDKRVALKKFFNANTYSSKEEINKINQEANINIY